ncbi:MULTISPECIES: TatD family hydrolase [Flavobacterium]|uniref:TatD family hydrolase n=1 Tax=Flavobacterium TaxID=237 RepID=UPI000969C8ED|nr:MULTISPECIES: TatD family hydrolase [Flavobacterium]OJX49920.1 MAG: hydrolase TatD [Flavobacterium sp. 38-13]
MLYNLHTHKFSNHPGCLELVNQYPQEFDASIPLYSIGIHPWYIVADRVEDDLAVIEEKIQTSNCLAVGECGLDKRIEIPFSLQEQVFRKQLALAQKYQKPVVIHCVASFQELIAIRNDLKITVPMIIHGFSKNEQLARQLLDNGFYLSFGKYLLRNPELESVFKNVPDNRFFLETDTIEETIEEVYAVASKYKGKNPEDLQGIVEQNFKNVFKK